MKDARAMLKKMTSKPAKRSALPWRMWFVWSAGGILAFDGINNVLDIFGQSQVWDLSDPLLGIPFRYLLPLVGLVELFAAWLCLFANKRNLSLWLVAWLMVNFVVYRLGLWTMGWPHPWVFVGGLTEALNISPFLADAILFQVTLYLLAGSAIVLLLPQTKTVMASEPVYFKVHCPMCGGKTAFDTQWVGQTISCPHCGNPLPLKRSA